VSTAWWLLDTCIGEGIDVTLVTYRKGGWHRRGSVGRSIALRDLLQLATCDALPPTTSGDSIHVMASGRELVWHVDGSR
jgi:hypothetical protein